MVECFVVENHEDGVDKDSFRGKDSSEDADGIDKNCPDACRGVSPFLCDKNLCCGMIEAVE